MVLGTVGLLGEPEDEVGAPVADVAADLEAAGSGAEVAPVAQRPFGHAEVAAGFLEGEHVVAGVLAGSWGVGLCGHGGLLVGGFPASFVAGRDGWVSVVERYASYGARWGAPIRARPGPARPRDGRPCQVAFSQVRRRPSESSRTHRVLLAGCRRERPVRVDQHGAAGSPESGEPEGDTCQGTCVSAGQQVSLSRFPADL